MAKRRPPADAEGAPPRVSDSVPQSAAESGMAHDPLHGKNVVLCVTGGIAAYKSAYLTRALVTAGARVMVILTEAAQKFVAPLTFETLSGNPVVTSTFEQVHQMGAVEHIDMAEWSDLVLVAPATYNCIGKLYAGVADDPVSTFLTAVTVPIFLSPAMNENMWRNPINQRNVQALTELGYRIIHPERGGLACSWEGEGRMAEPDDILARVRASLLGRDIPTVTLPEPAPVITGDASDNQVPAAASGAATSRNASPANVGASLAGRTVLITAAGTQEAIDPVRFIGNRSSGRMGYALAEEARRRGARVLLVSGPSALPEPQGLAKFERIESAEQLLQRTQALLQQADVLLMAAAVADYRPRQVADSKLKRRSDDLAMQLEPTPDLLATLAKEKEGRFFVGFALETDNLAAEAQRKLQAKGCDLIVANRVSAESGPDVPTNQVSIFNDTGLVAETPVLPKTEIATRILDVVEQQLQKHSVAP